MIYVRSLLLEFCFSPNVPTTPTSTRLHFGTQWFRFEPLDSPAIGTVPMEMHDLRPRSLNEIRAGI
jgi:hypothetical protein